ncbi:MAG: hypothetical protein RTU92_04545 [Candidatus Thorarchaeota archaeon]
MIESRTLLITGMVGSIIGVTGSILTVSQYYVEWRWQWVFTPSGFLAVLLMTFWFGGVSLGFLGVRRNYGRKMALIPTIVNGTTALLNASLFVSILFSYGCSPCYSFAISLANYSTIGASISLITAGIVFVYIQYETGLHIFTEATGVLLVISGILAFIPWFLPLAALPCSTTAVVFALARTDLDELDSIRYL